MSKTHAHILLILIVLTSAEPGRSTGLEFRTGYWSSNDSLILVTGHIRDSLTGEGIGEAQITYKELPYGNYVGVIQSREGDGFYSYRTFGHSAYCIQIESNDYVGIRDTIFPLEEGNSDRILIDYLLSMKPSKRMIPLDNLIFDLGRSEIKPESFNELDELVKLMMDNPQMIIQLEGHTDFRGGRTKNLKLSEERVKQVKNYLIHGGIMPNRILTKAYGGSNPISREDSEEARRLNRRVEVIVLKQ